MRNARFIEENSTPFDFAAAMTITVPDLALKGRFQGGYSLKAERVRRPRAERYGPHPGGSGIMPAGTMTGARGASLDRKWRVRHAAAFAPTSGSLARR